MASIIIIIMIIIITIINLITIIMKKASQVAEPISRRKCEEAKKRPRWNWKKIFVLSVCLSSRCDNHWLKIYGVCRSSSFQDTLQYHCWTIIGKVFCDKLTICQKWEGSDLLPHKTCICLNGMRYLSKWKNGKMYLTKLPNVFLHKRSGHCRLEEAM